MGFRNAPTVRKLRTAPSGPRIEIGSGNTQQIDLYTGDAQEAPAGQGQVLVDVVENNPGGVGKDYGAMLLRTPVIGPGSNFSQAGVISGRGPTRDGTTGPGWFLHGDVDFDGKLNGAPYVPYSKRPRTWEHRRYDETTAATSGYGANTWVQLLGYTFAAAPAGDYLVTATVVLQATAAAQGFAQLQIGSPAADYLQNPGSFARCDVTTSALPYTFTVPVQGWAGGDLTVAFWHNSGAASNTLHGPPSRLIAAYLGPRT
jgi:hypothetical protein